MPRRPSGLVVEVPGKRGTAYALRFHANGTRHYVTLGREPDWTRRRADEELAYVLAQVERGTWQPASRVATAAREDPTFHVFASEWFEQTRNEWKPATVRAYRDELTLHLLPYFAKHRISEITIEEVDRYRSFKLREKTIGPPTINKTLTRLGQILEQAVEYGHLARNPAKGKRRRLKVTTPPRSYLDRAEHFEALLAAAGTLDREAREDRRHIGRRAMLATLAYGGLRIGELLALRWRDVDLAAGRLHVGDSKTVAGIRTVRLLPVLRDELATWKATTSGKPAGYVFATATGGRLSESNLRNRVLAPAVKLADARLEDAGAGPLPASLTPHGLRHSFASLLVALGKDPRYVMDQIGHTDPAFTLRLYTHSMRQEDGDRERLAALVGELSAASPTAAGGRAISPARL